MAWNRVDFPTFAKPTWVAMEVQQRVWSINREPFHTYDTTFQAVTRPAQKHLLLLFFLLGGHPTSESGGTGSKAVCFRSN